MDQRTFELGFEGWIRFGHREIRKSTFQGKETASA